MGTPPGPPRPVGVPLGPPALSGRQRLPPQCVSLPAFEQWAPKELQETHAPKLPEAFWAKHGPKPHCVIRSPHEPFKWGDW